MLSAAMLITPLTIPAMADNGIQVTINGEAIPFYVPPQMVNDRTMVPLRAIFEALGASVDWNPETSTVTSTKDSSVSRNTGNGTKVRLPNGNRNSRFISA